MGSIGSVGDSYDNSMAEALNSICMAELVRNKGPWAGIADVEGATMDYIDWYNTVRLHGELGHVSPAEHVATWPSGQALAASSDDLTDAS